MAPFCRHRQPSPELAQSNAGKTHVLAENISSRGPDADRDNARRASFLDRKCTRRARGLRNSFARRESRADEYSLKLVGTYMQNSDWSAERGTAFGEALVVALEDFLPARMLRILDDIRGTSVLGGGLYLRRVCLGILRSLVLTVRHSPNVQRKGMISQANPASETGAAARPRLQSPEVLQLMCLDWRIWP